MQKIKAAIIGCGNIHQVHADVLKKIKIADLNYMVDIKTDRAKKAAQKYNCNYLTNYKKLLNKNIDAVHICTPHYLHAPMAVEFLKNNINVLLEKPLALNYKEGQKIVEAEKNSTAKLTVCFQNRFNTNNQKAKRILEANNLGKVKGIKAIVTWHRGENYYLEDDWRGKYATEGGGVLINQAIHTLDLMQWFGGSIKDVKGNTDTRVLDKVIEVEDTAEATLYFENGALGIFYATNTFTDNSPIEIVIDCEKGSLRLFDDQLIIKTADNTNFFEENNKGNYKAYWGYGHQKLIKKFYQNISNNNQKLINASEAIKSLKLIKEINDSSKNII